MAGTSSTTALAVQQQVRLRSDSNTANSSDFSAGESTSELLEIDTPPLVLISSRIKSSGALSGCVNTGVVVVRYTYDSTSLAKLLQLVASKMRGRHALSIAFLMHGNSNSLKICSQKAVTVASLREDRDLRQFLLDLVSTYLNKESQYARIDLLHCPVIESDIGGKQLMAAMKELVKVPVTISSEILGAYLTESEQRENKEESSRSLRVGMLYFDDIKVKEQWIGLAPQTMALFERIRPVGKGAYGTAVLYRKKDDDSLVVLKEINIMELSKAERGQAMNEVQILSRLDHPNIISYYDNFEQEGVLMIEMEYADGGTLAQFLRAQTKPLSEKEILRMFSQMVDALLYLHGHNILHRDLKTENVFLTKENIIKLGDFGIAKVLSATNQQANTVLGTPYYISPEICEGKGYNDKSDIWALGCILYEMACLERTFEGTNLPAVIHKIVQVSFTPVKGDYSEGFKQLIVAMLQKDPEARPSATELNDTYLPPLLDTEEMDTSVNQEEEVIDNTERKSYVYYLDGQSLLLKPINITIKPLIDHVSVGFSHIVAVNNEHVVYSWGENSHGQLGHGDTKSRTAPEMIEALKGRPILRAECGGEFSFFRNDNGIIMSCGRGDQGVLGHKDCNLEDCLKPRLVEELLSTDTLSVSCGESHVVALTSDGDVFAWGNGRNGRLGTGNEEMCCIPTRIMIKSAGRLREVISDVRCGMDGTMFLTEMGRLYACGSNYDNKLGLNRRETFIGQMRRILSKTQLQVPQTLVATPIKELGKHRVVDMSLGPTHSCVVVETGRVYTFGRNTEGQLCTGNLLAKNMPSVIKGIPTKPMTVTCTELASIVTTEDNSFLVWGSRPIIRSPLLKFLHQTISRSSTTSELKTKSETGSGSGSVKERANSLRREESDVFEEDNLLRVSSALLSPTSFEVGNSFQSISSGQSASKEASPERKTTTTTDNVVSSKTPPKEPSNESLNQSNPKFIVGTIYDSKELHLRRYSSLNLSDTPHITHPCSSSKDYIELMNSLLQEVNRALVVDLERNPKTVSSPAVRHREALGSAKDQPTSQQPQQQQISTKANKRIYSSSTDVVMMDGVIMRPTSIDLVGRSGLLSTLSVQGLTNAKLEGVSCFGGNVLILIEAQVLLEVDEGKEGAQQRVSLVSKMAKQPRLVLGRKLTEKSVLRKRKILSPRFSPPVERKGGVDQSTASFTEPMRPSASQNTFMATIRQKQGSEEEEGDESDDEVPTWIQKELDFAVKETNKKQLLGRSSRTSIDSDILPTFDPVDSPVGRVSDIQPPKLFAPTPTPGQEVKVPCSDDKTSYRQQSEREKRPESRGQRIRLEPVRMPILRLQTSTSTTSLQRLNDGTPTGPSLLNQWAVGVKPSGPLGLKKAYSNVDVGPSSQIVKATSAKRPSHSAVKVTSNVSSFQKNVPQQFTSPIKRTTSSGSVKNPSPLSSPRRDSGSNHTSPDRKGSGASQTTASPASPSEGSEVSSDRDLRSPALSSSSEGEMFKKGATTRRGSNPQKKSKATSASVNKRGSKQAAANTGHAIPVTSTSPYAEPSLKIQRKTLTSSRSAGNKIQTGTGRHQLQKKNSAAALTEKQLKEAQLQAEEEAEEKVKRKTEKIHQEKKKAEEEFDRERQELQEKAKEQQQQAVQREEELHNIIDQLKTELAKQSSALQENTDMVKSLQQQVKQLHKTPPNSPTIKRHFRLRKSRSARASRSTEDADGTSTSGNKTKSAFCVVS